MSPLYLKMVALGVAGATVATAVPLSVLKSSGGADLAHEHRTSGSLSNDRSIEEESSGLAINSSNHSEGLTRLDSRAMSDRELGTERSINSLSPAPSELTEARERVASVQDTLEIKDCKEVAKSREGRLNVCYDKNIDKVTFKFDEFLGSSSGSETVNASYEVGNSFTYFLTNNLKIEVIGIDNSGRNNREVELDLPPDISSEKSSFSFTSKYINKDQCVVNWTTDKSTGKNVDWKVKC